LEVELTDIGKTVENKIVDISRHYENVYIDTFIIMPNHIHLLLRIERDESDPTPSLPVIGRIIQQFKAAASKESGFSIWQKAFYEHIIRTEKEYDAIWNYIENNPIKWVFDKYYAP
jgi:REP element-mobilizing transposase RayT